MADSTLKGLFGGGEDADGSVAQGGNPLGGLFGGGDLDSDRDGARDFINRVTTGRPDEGFSTQEALTRLAQAQQRATPDQMRRAAERATSRLDENQRADFAKMLQERMGGVDRGPSPGRGRGDDLAGMLGDLFSGGGGMGGLLGGLMGGGGGADPRATRGGGGGLDDLFGGLLGSSAGKAALGGLAAYALSELLDGR